MTDPVRILVADDEEMARKRATRLLSALDGVEVVTQCSNGQEVLDQLAQVDVDALLLDIQMPHLSGIELRGLLEEGAPHVILCTAHPEYAVDAFDLGVVDYILKPLEAARLKKAIDRVHQLLRPIDAQTPGTLALPRLPVESKGRLRLVDPAEVSHATLEGQLVTLHLPEESLLTEFTLRDLEQRLPCPPFQRVHRRGLVNLLAIHSLEDNGTGGYLAHLKGGGKVEVARQAARRLRRVLQIR